MEALVDLLRRRGRIPAGVTPRIEPLVRRGANATCRVTIGSEALLVKIGVPHWWQVEARIQDAAARRCPGYVPAVIDELPEIHGFAMEYVVPADARPWKAMLADDRDGTRGAHVGDHLGRFHRQSMGCAASEQAAAGNRAKVVERRAWLWTCAHHDARLGPVVGQTLRETLDRRLALSHGDVGPGNVLVARDRILLVDFEYAWFGDPAFDCGWMLSGLMVGAMRARAPEARSGLVAAIRSAGAAWLAHVDWEPTALAENRAARIALVRCISRHHALAQRTPAPPPPPVRSAIDGLAGLLPEGGGGFEALADTLARRLAGAEAGPDAARPPAATRLG